PICILLGIDMQKKWRDRLPCLHSTIPKSFSFSESDRRGISKPGLSLLSFLLNLGNGFALPISPQE
ncbi:hypothetical protein, partial [Roseofilum sp. SID3]|uniref:hypothetical protein n=1 Tax=Roseofilum sp. SID3 TaxID=2821499 RepID=UPI00298D9DC0